MRTITPRGAWLGAALLLALALSGSGCTWFASLCDDDDPEPLPPPAGDLGPGTPGVLDAGVGVVDVTPPLASGPPLAGFAGAPRRVFDAVTIPLNLAALGGSCVDPDPATAYTLFSPAQGQRDPILARALVLANGTRKIAIVRLDLIGMSRRLRDDLATQAATLGIASQDLAVVATHTHSGPGGLSNLTLWQVGAADCFSDAIYQRVLRGAWQALIAANVARAPAQLGFGSVPVTGASRNRAGRPDVLDTDLTLLKITTSGGAPLAALFNFAVHGTSFGESHMKLSADNMGEMERVVEAGLPGVRALFTNAAEGDVAPQHRDEVGVLLQGQIVGSAVLALWPTVTTQPWVKLEGALQDVTMPAPHYNPLGCMPLPGTTQTICSLVPGAPIGIPLTDRWISTKLPFQALRIGDSVLVGIPGEPITEIGWEIEQRAAARGFARGIVLGLANDHGGYFTTAAEYQRGSYEGKSTMYGATTGQHVVNAADAVIALVQ